MDATGSSAVLNDRDGNLSFGSLCVPYQYGEGPAPVWPFSRYLPNIPVGLINRWIKDEVPAGSLILDPFGAAPAMLIELAQAGYAVVTCMLNPALRLTLDGACRRISQPDALEILNELAKSSKDNTSFDNTISAFYQTQCVSCGQDVQVEEYSWVRGEKYPEKVIYTCSTCHGHQEAAPSKPDLAIIDRIHLSHYSRALAIGRITGGNQELLEDAQAIVDHHLPRSLYVVVSLFNRLDALNLPPQKAQFLRFLLIQILDEANCLWPVDNEKFRPLALTIPSKFKEINLWQKLKDAALYPFSTNTRVQIKQYPDLPSPGTICIYPGRMKDLLTASAQQYDHVVTAIPRPNQAFWKLSAAWSAWLLDMEESRKFINMIIRDRYDWTWHSRALTGIFQQLAVSRKITGSISAVLTDNEPAFLASILPSSQKGGWKLSEFSLREEDGIAELRWQQMKEYSNQKQAGLKEIETGSTRYLHYKNEPADFQEMTCAALLHLSHENMLLEEQEGLSIKAQLKQGFSSPTQFNHLGSGSLTQESGLWWLNVSPNKHPTAFDLVELETIRLLNLEQEVTLRGIEQENRHKCPAIFAGVEEYIRKLLESYASPVAHNIDAWVINQKEIESNRLETIKKLQHKTIELGRKLRFTVEGSEPICWLDTNGLPAYHFYISYHTAILGDLLYSPRDEGKNILVLPASRLNLLAYKQKKSPLMNQLLSSGWHIVKFRLMGRLLENPNFTREKFEELIGTDPVENNPDQLFLF